MLETLLAAREVYTRLCVFSYVIFKNMAGTAGKKTDVSRLVRSYPFIRTAPKYVWQFDKGVALDVGSIAADPSQTTYTYTFQSTFTSAPYVVVSPQGTQSNVSLHVTAVTTTSVTIEASTPFSGTINIHAYYIPT